MITLANDQRDLIVQALDHYRQYLERVAKDCSELTSAESLEVYSDFKRKADRVGVVSVLVFEAAAIELSGKINAY